MSETRSPPARSIITRIFSRSRDQPNSTQGNVIAVKTLKSVVSEARSEVTPAGQSAAQPINMHCVNDL